MCARICDIHELQYWMSKQSLVLRVSSADTRLITLQHLYNIEGAQQTGRLSLLHYHLKYVTLSELMCARICDIHELQYWMSKQSLVLRVSSADTRLITLQHLYNIEGAQQTGRLSLLHYHLKYVTLSELKCARICDIHELQYWMSKQSLIVLRVSSADTRLITLQHLYNILEIYFKFC